MNRKPMCVCAHTPTLTQHTHTQHIHTKHIHAISTKCNATTAQMVMSAVMRWLCYTVSGVYSYGLKNWKSCPQHYPDRRHIK